MKTIAVALTFVFFLIGCSTRLGDFTIMSNRNIEFQSEHSLVKRNVKGSDGVVWLLLFIPVTNMNIESAIDDILTENEADFLTNVVIKWKWWTTILVGWEGFVLTGDAWRNGAAPTGALTIPEDVVRRGREYKMIPLDSGESYKVVEKS